MPQSLDLIQDLPLLVALVKAAEQEISGSLARDEPVAGRTALFKAMGGYNQMCAAAQRLLGAEVGNIFHPYDLPGLVYRRPFPEDLCRSYRFHVAVSFRQLAWFLELHAGEEPFELDSKGKKYN